METTQDKAVQKRTSVNKRSAQTKDVPKRTVRPENTTKRPIKGKKRKKKRSGCLVPFIIIVLVIAFFAFIGSKYLSRDLSTGDEQMEIAVEIPDGSTVFGIADILEENNVIDNALHFKVLCKLNSKGSEFRSGYYIFTNDMTFDELTDLLSSGAASSNALRLTVREGMWLTEIADAVAQTGICTREEFMEAANSKDYDYDFLKDIPDRDNALEGYLYPNTYFLQKDMTARDVVDMLLGEFDKQITDNDIISKAKKQGKTLDEIVIIASLIEAEVKYEPERTIVASVIYNRLNTNTKLQIDASVLYSLGERKTRVYYSDLENPEKHNTYYVDGLPEGPINSPRIASIAAACEPDDTSYMFYVVEDTNTGQHAFCETYDEFTKAKEKYLAQVN